MCTRVRSFLIISSTSSNSFEARDLAVLQWLREGNYGLIPYCDGDVYRNIRQCQALKDETGRQHWLAKLSESKRKDFIQMDTRAVKNPAMNSFVAALDRLLPFAGLWVDYMFGCFHRLLSMHCLEVSGIPKPYDFRLPSIGVYSLSGKNLHLLEHYLLWGPFPSHGLDRPSTSGEISKGFKK